MAEAKNFSIEFLIDRGRRTAGGPVRVGAYVTDLVTGWTGRVVKRAERLDEPTMLKVAPEFQIGKKAAAARWVREDMVRMNAPIRRTNAKAGVPVRHAHFAQQEIVEVLWQFAARLQHHPKLDPVVQRSSDFTAVPLAHIDAALEEILEALGYRRAGQE